MRLLCVSALLGLALGVGGNAATVRGHWELDRVNPASNFYNLTLHQEGVIVNATQSVRVNSIELRGFRAEGEKTGFQLVRDAGTLYLEPDGTYRFEEDARFVGALRGFAGGWGDPTRIYTMALRGVTLKEVEAMRDSGQTGLTAFDVQLKHDSTEFSATERDRLKAHQVDPAYVRRLKENYPVTTDDAIRLHDAGVDPKMVDALHRGGYDVMPVSDMLKLQTYGVSAYDMQKLDNLGIRNLSVDDIVKMKVDGTLR